MSKNVFLDLGFDEEEAAGLKLKSYLFMSLQEAITKSRKKQGEIAALIGADQPKVSKIMSGKLDEFSIERITEYMQKLGYDIHISANRAPKGRSQGTVILDKGKLVEV
jgi:predicted XRE-type DNA-binding protein